MRIDGVGFVPPAVMGQSPAAPAKGGITQAFTDYLEQALKDLNTMQANASALQDAYASGKLSDVHQVVIASQEAGVALDLVLAVRNQVVRAYEQLMQMQV